MLEPKVGVTVLAGALAAAVSLCPARSEANVFDLGVQGGLLKRSLSDTDYKTSFAWQLHGELMFFPMLMAGPYVTFTSATADVPGGETPSSISFRTIGFRGKLKIPVSDSFQPYGVAGAGWAHANFPDQTLRVCSPPDSMACVQRTVPSATGNFAELLIGGGVMWVVVPPLALTAEFNWRPTIGYTNDTYERQIQARDPNAPDPSGNGNAWVGLLGIAITL